MADPQARGTLQWTHRKYWLFGPMITETCALGAAIRAVGCGSHQQVSNGKGKPFRGKAVKSGDKVNVIEFPDDWLPLLRMVPQCPVTLCKESDEVDRLVTHLNDDHRWTREQIAEWIETLEPPKEQGASHPKLAKVELGQKLGML